MVSMHQLVYQSRMDFMGPALSIGPSADPETCRRSASALDNISQWTTSYFTSNNTDLVDSSDGSLSVQLFSFQNDSDLFGSADYAVAISPPQGFFLFPNNTMNNWNWLANDTFLATNTSWALQNYVLRPNVAVHAVCCTIVSTESLFLCTSLTLFREIAWHLSSDLEAPCHLTVSTGPLLSMHLLSINGRVRFSGYAYKNASGEQGHLGLVRQGGAAINPARYIISMLSIFPF